MNAKAVEQINTTTVANSPSMAQFPPAIGHLPQGTPATILLQLQRAQGNRFAQQFLRVNAIQAKLTVSEPGDEYEQEADRIAEQVVRMSDLQRVTPHPSVVSTASPSQVQRMGVSDEEEKGGSLQRKEQNEGVDFSDPIPAKVNEPLSYPGQPLDAQTRAFFEPRFGHDFGHVRIHTDSRANNISRSLQARAFTIGQDIVFGAGEFAPETADGRRLIAHELTHTIQRTTSNSMVPLERMIQRYAVPYSMPTRAHANTRSLQGYLNAAIPEERRTGEARHLYYFLPALANILDAYLNEAARGEILNPASPSHPQHYDNVGLPDDLRNALWDYYKARWESPNRSTRRRWVESGKRNANHYLLASIIRQHTGEYSDEIREMVKSLIRDRSISLYRENHFVVLSQGGVPVEQNSMAEGSSGNRPSRRRGSGGGRSVPSTTVGSMVGVEATEHDRRMVRFINPAMLRYIPHEPSSDPNPRHQVFDDLATALQQIDQDTQAGTDVQQALEHLEQIEITTRPRILNYLGSHPGRLHKLGISLADAVAQINTSEMVVETDIASHDITVGNWTIHLNPVAPGALVERPGGFTASVTEETVSTQGQRSSHRIRAVATDALVTEALSGFGDTHLEIAQNYLEIIRRGEGSLSSLNTWDRLRLTLGSGLGAAGRLQRAFYEFHQNDPAEFQRLFGQYGIEIVGSERHPRFRITNSNSGQALEGDDATEYIANNPRLLAVLVLAGFDAAWQRNLLNGVANSIREAFSYDFSVSSDGHTTEINLFDFLNSHIDSNLSKVAMFTIADDIHGYGHVKEEVNIGLSRRYLTLTGEAHQNPHAPDSINVDVRRQLAIYLGRTHSHKGRRRHIAEVLGFSAFADIFN